MSEGDHDGREAVDQTCDACDRGIPAFLREESLSLWLDVVSSQDGALSESERRAETLCGDCAAEVRELTDDMDATDLGPADPLACGLCSESLATPLDVLTLRAGDSHEGTGDRFALCSACDDVFAEFLGNVPEHDAAGDLYTGGADADPSSVDDSVDDYDSLRIGDEIRVESRVAASVGSPSTHHEVAGTVEERSETHGIAHVRFASETGTARLTRPAPTVDRLTLQSLDDGIEDLGTVTSLTVESRAPRSAEEAPETALELDADSALIPDSLDVESSAD